MTSFLPPVQETLTRAEPQTVVDLGDRSVVIPPQSAPSLVRWLEANGIDTKAVFVDQTIFAKGGRIRCSAVDLDERGIIKWTGADRATTATKLIDVPMTREPHEFGFLTDYSKRPKEAMTQTPSVGRVAHYYDHDGKVGEYEPRPRAAIITAVEGPEGDWISLAVLDMNGIFFHENVPFSEEPKPGHWSWPPRV